ncbi:phospholipase D/nuclease [Rhizodiscina lignyota]|uniref:Phospholipase D/nuclease n=1 Tax=Rhizodiscina lignyota TaxID=1504668 RepID=A0A9P4I7R1_9PEZI|nr:phospholipase D/nuclease [Rhizodiscina lignyota]
MLPKLREHPNYFYKNPDVLVSNSIPDPLILGSGDEIFQSVLPEVERAESELVIVTCFWARSSSRDRLNSSLQKLSSRVVQEGKPRIKVFIGLSSVSLLQKLFHTSSTNGYTYRPSEWQSKLGLPSPTELNGLDLTVKSMFFLPFSVMHPKFIIVDRKTVFLPSCNVSWETWFEGCVRLAGPIVAKFVDFWSSFWLPHGGTFPSESQAEHMQSHLNEDRPAMIGRGVLSVFLPSPHHRNPCFRPFPWQRAMAPPATPLNVFLVTLLSSATTTIYIQTPNVTAPPVLSGLLDALQRGVDVHIVTSERLMILEQLVTAGTTTTQCLKGLIRRYKRFLVQANSRDEEAGLRSLGQLRIEYYTPRSGRGIAEPIQSHLKLTIVDNQWVVLGSGNLDRASFYTSQELGVAFLDTAFAKNVVDTVDAALQGRKKLYFASTI